MMKFLGIPIKVHPLLPFVLVIAMLLGAGADLGIALGSLLLHELSHVLAALALRVRVQEIELMPLGGAARMEDIWQLRPLQLVLISLAGPLTNALLIIMASALAWSNWMGPYTAMLWIRINLAMMLFNLLPALPLDGGRVLCALTSRFLGTGRAIRWGVLCGRALSVLLMGLSLWMLFSRGTMNLTFAFAAGFLWLSAGREQQLSSGAPLMSMLRRQEELSAEGALPIRWLAVSGDQTVSEALGHMQSRQLHRIAVYDAALNCLGSLEERQLMHAVAQNSGLPIAQLLKDNAAANKAM